MSFKNVQYSPSSSRQRMNMLLCSHSNKCALLIQIQLKACCCWLLKGWNIFVILASFIKKNRQKRGECVPHESSTVKSWEWIYLQNSPNFKANLYHSPHKNSWRMNGSFSFHWYDTSTQVRKKKAESWLDREKNREAEWIVKNKYNTNTVSHGHRQVCVRAWHTDWEASLPHQWLGSRDWGDSSTSLPDIHKETERQQMRRHNAHVRDHIDCICVSGYDDTVCVKMDVTVMSSTICVIEDEKSWVGVRMRLRRKSKRHMWDRMCRSELLSMRFCTTHK